MGIAEKGPRKLILSVIAMRQDSGECSTSENIPVNFQNVDHTEETIRSILAKEPKFIKILTRQLDNEIIPDSKGLLHMNRILTNHYFEHRILQEHRYPSWQEKQKLAERIIEAFPHLEKTRVSADAPKESFFFWKNGGKGRGQHAGIIETRVANMRKDIPTNERLFQRAKKLKTVLPEGIREKAAKLAALTGNALNGKVISDGMAQCFLLHQDILQSGGDNMIQEIITTFPHLLGFDGVMIQQAYERLHTNYNTEANMEEFLSVGLLMDQGGWNNVTDKHIRGALRIIKRLTSRGIKRTSNVQSATMEEITAAPLIKWMKPDPEKTNLQVVQVANISMEDRSPHIICVAEPCKEGQLFIVFASNTISCDRSSSMAIDVLLKLFDVFGVPVPPLLKKFHELVTFYLFRTTLACKSTKVAELVNVLREHDENV
ncbi:uncharacterized protein LOC134212780 isoform X3 [Armigeres subalbatus]